MVDGGVVVVCGLFTTGYCELKSAELRVRVSRHFPVQGRARVAELP